jgi:hypothetical protein
MGRRKAPETRAKTLAGQVRDWVGISRVEDRVGRMMLKPLMKYSWTLLGGFYP